MFLSKRTLIDFWIFLVFASIFDIVFTFRILRYESSEEMNFIMKSILGFGLKQVFLTNFLPLFALGSIIVFGNKIRYPYRKQFLNWGIIICALILLIVLIVHLYFYFSLIFSENVI